MQKVSKWLVLRGQASKGIADLFANTGVLYKPFAIYSRPDKHDVFDVELNARALVHKRSIDVAQSLFARNPELKNKLEAKLPSETSV